MKKDLLKTLIETNTIIPPLSDTICKRIFIEHLDYLAVILSNVLPLTKEEIMNGKFINNELPASNISLKSSRLDLVLQVGKYFIDIEINKEINIQLLIRNAAHYHGLIYKIYSDKNKKDLNDYLCTVNFNGENYKTDELMINLKFADTKLNIEEDNMAKVHLNLAIAKDKYYNKEEINTFERYLAILMLTNVEELKKLAKGDEILESVARDLISYSRAREIVDAYEKEMLEENYQRNRLEATKEEAEKRGMEEGVKKGIEQGIEQGTKQRNVEIAKNLLSLKLSKEDISKATGLSIKEIEALK